MLLGHRFAQEHGPATCHTWPGGINKYAVQE